MPKRKTVLTGWLHPPQPDNPAVAGKSILQDQLPPAGKIIQQTLYLLPAVHDQLRTLAFHRRVKMHTIVMEGLDAIFRESGLKSISELSAPK